MSDDAEPPRKNAEKPRGKPFQPGNAGKPKGARHKTTLAVEALMEGEAEEITRKAIEAAKGGDMSAIRLVLERIAPAQKERTVTFDMPKIEGAEDLPGAVMAIMGAVADGSLTPGEATSITGLLDAYLRQTETATLEARIKALEEISGAANARPN